MLSTELGHHLCDILGLEGFCSAGAGLFTMLCLAAPAGWDLGSIIQTCLPKGPLITTLITWLADPDSS